MNKRLYRSRKDKVLAGVCGGVAEYFKIDVTIVRILVVILTFPSMGVGFVGYIIAAIIIPERPDDYVEEPHEPGTSKTSDEDETYTEHQTISFDNKDTRRTLGFLLVGVGSLILMSRLISWFDSGMIVAIAVIAIGVFVLVKKN